MAVEWQPRRVGETFRVNPTRDIPRGRVTPFIPMEALPENERAPRRVDQRAFTGSGARFQNGDTLIARITPCLENGKTAFIAGLPEGVVAHGSTEFIVVAGRSGESDDLFAYYLARSPDFRRYAIGQMEGTSGRQRVPTVAVENFTTRLPLLSEQRAIAHVLGALDDKIELNRRMNETLEAITLTIFKSWFVDFDPVRAKASGESPESICHRLGLTPDCLDLFPQRLADDSELGEIPEGWDVKRLDKITSYLSRGISPKYIVGGGVLVVNQKCVRDGRVDLSKARRHDPAQRNIADRFLEVGDVLVNSTGVGTLGRVAQVLGIQEPTIVDSHVTVVRANSDLVSWNYLGVALQRRQAEIEALGEGSTGQTELSRARLAALPVLLPPKPLRDHFDEVVLGLRFQTKRNDEQNLTIASVRDTLLPKLISGELRVPLEGAA